MKKLTFSFILVIGFFYGFSTSVIFAKQPSSVRTLPVWLSNRMEFLNQKIRSLAGISKRLPILYHELNQSPIDPVTEKMKTVEALRFTKECFLTSFPEKQSVKLLTDDNIASTFLMDIFPSGR
jgi:hypothetical protein